MYWLARHIEAATILGAALVLALGVGCVWLAARLVRRWRARP